MNIKNEDTEIGPLEHAISSKVPPNSKIIKKDIADFKDHAYENIFQNQKNENHLSERRNTEPLIRKNMGRSTRIQDEIHRGSFLVPNKQEPAEYREYQTAHKINNSCSPVMNISDFGESTGSSQKIQKPKLNQYSMPKKPSLQHMDYESEESYNVQERDISILLPRGRGRSFNLSHLASDEFDIVHNKTAQHHTPKLSISSHFNQFNLEDDDSFTSKTNHLEHIISELKDVDSSNVNNYLMRVLRSLDSYIPIDDFYLLLYNDNRGPVSTTPKSWIDNTFANYEGKRRSMEVVSYILNLFSNPSQIEAQLPWISTDKKKSSNINYDELLRTFLAIKILLDILIQVPSRNSAQDYTIPRLSIYKTYHIICSRLITSYCIISAAEANKLILGQSKLGKLLKLTHPNLIIKRLGSRGDSKYNYLGVIWNEKIVDEGVKILCEKNDLASLEEILKHERKKAYLNKSQRNESKVINNFVGSTQSECKNKGSSQVPAEITLSQTKAASLPVLSFIEPELRYPDMEDFSFLKPDSGFLNYVKRNGYNYFASFDVPFSMHDRVVSIFLKADNSDNHDSLKSYFVSDLLVPISVTLKGSTKADLNLYLIVLTEVLPYLLFVKKSTEKSFLKNIRPKLLYFTANLIQDLEDLNLTAIFPTQNCRKFLHILKSLININDLLVTFLKSTSHAHEVREAVVYDITTYLQDPQISEHAKVPENIVKANSDNYREKIILKNIISTCIAYGFRPSSNSSSKDIEHDAEIIYYFITGHLLGFISEGAAPHNDAYSSYENGDLILSHNEASKLHSLLTLIHTHLLPLHIRKRYPIILFNSLVSSILNDTLKYIFSRNQSALTNELAEHENVSFSHWWVFNSILEEYLELMGGIIGLHNIINK